MILRNKLLIKLMSPGLWVLCFFTHRVGEVLGKWVGKEGGGYELKPPPLPSKGGERQHVGFGGVAGGGGCRMALRHDGERAAS